MSNFVDETYKRVVQIIKYNNLNISSFEDRISVSNNSIGTAIRRKASFKSNVLNKILIAFPEIDPTWLLTGKGDMLLPNHMSLKEPNIHYQALKMNKQIKENLIELLIQDEEVQGVFVRQVKSVLENS